MLDEVNHELYVHCEDAANEIVGRILNQLNEHFRKMPVPASFAGEGQDYLNFLVRRASCCGLENVGTVAKRAAELVRTALEGLSAAERFVLDCYVLEMREQVPEDEDDPSLEANEMSNELPDNDELTEYIVGFWGDHLYDARDDEEERDSRLDITVTPLKLGDKCPYCGGRLLPVVYGEPGPELFEKADRGEVILGGCIVSGLDPEKECAECGFQFLEVDEKELRG